MKKMSKIIAMLIAMVMVLSMSISAFAADDPTEPEEPAYQTYEDGDGTITVNNAASGETYYAIKALSATVSEDGINYTGDIPNELAGVIELKTDANGFQYIDKIAGVTDAQWQAAMRAYANAHDSEWGQGIVCSGNSVTFTDLDLGYYVIVSTYFDEEKGEDETTNKVSAGSTFSSGDAPHTPDGEVYEKNTKEVVVEKASDGDSYTIGDTVTYTVTFNGMNYYGEGEDAELVQNYIVNDTLPDFLDEVEVTEIAIGEEKPAVTNANFPGVEDFGTSKTFTIPWATQGTDGFWTSKYANGVEVSITYTAVLTDIVKIDGNEGEGNTNTISIVPQTATGQKEPYEDTKEIFTYGAALKKTDGEKTLAGAKFQFKGLELTPETGGIYTVVSYDPEGDYGTEVEVGADGMLYILGLAEDVTLTGKETVAPKGFNLLTTEFELTPQTMSHTIWSETGDKEFDAEGNLVAETSESSTTETVTKNINDLDADALEVVNQAGTELPTTGGIGTTMFYVIGAVLVVGAGVILISRRRMGAR